MHATVVGQNAALALRACNTGYVMENGTVILSGAAQELLRNDRVRQAYLGE